MLKIKYYFQEIKIDNVKFSVKDIRDKLIPVLKDSESPDTLSHSIQKWATTWVDECKTGLSMVLPFRKPAA